MTFTKFYFGIDSNSAGPFPCPGDGSPFYLGRLGGGSTSSGGGNGWNLSTAELAGAEVTSGYWDIEGPGAIPAGSTAYAWGTHQAQAFINAQATTVYKSHVGGTTFFGDIEGGNTGWSVVNQADAQQIVYGFLNLLSSKGLTPGLYANIPDWDNLIGQSWTSPVEFVWWLADTYAGITTCAEAQNELNTLFSGSTYDRGGMKVMVWQYNQTPGSPRDLDLSPYNGYLFGHWNPTPA